MEKIKYQNLRDICSEKITSLRLRPIRKDDTENIVRWRNNEAVKPFFIFREPFTREIHSKWLEEKVYKGEVIQYIIEVGEKHIGSVYIRDIDTNNESGEFGIFIGESSYTSKGLGTEIAKMIVSYCFELGFHRIFLRVLAENTRAVKSYLKAGFVQEGTAKEMIRGDGNWHDVIFMSIINQNKKIP